MNFELSTGFVLFVVLVLAGTVRPAPAWGTQEGKTIFQQKCTACHTIGGGKLVGPDLKGITQKRGRAWLSRWIREPDKMISEGEPLAAQLLKEFNDVPMPNLALTKADAAAVISYLEETLRETALPQTTPQAAHPVSPGDPVIGKDLFTGSVRFENGGPPCMACHSISGIGALGGGSLGPDLTETNKKFGETLSVILADPPFPTMKPIFEAKPLSPEEQGHLLAFFATAGIAKRPFQSVGILVLLSAAGAILLFILVHLKWRGRLKGVREPMVHQAKEKK